MNKHPRHNHLLKLILSALFLAIAFVLPFLTGQIPEIGSMLCPLHIPVLLCGFICGWPWGLAVGFIAPLFRSLILTMPPLFPTAVCMAFELAAYGAVAGLLHRVLPRKKPFIYVSLLVAMIAGRIVWGIAMMIFMGVTGGTFTFAAFLAAAFTNAVPGIILQILLIPVLVMALDNPRILNLKN
ncbi:MAG: ECF transporter S component [Clostridiales bacterium]|nr:ECF transporter S component [Clostridiales bacterium]